MEEIEVILKTFFSFLFHFFYYFFLNLSSFQLFLIYLVLIGRHPEPSESQRRAVEKLASKLYLRAPKSSKSSEDDTEEIVEIDLLDSPRVILFDGKILKRSNIFRFLF